MAQSPKDPRFRTAGEKAREQPKLSNPSRPHHLNRGISEQPLSKEIRAPALATAGASRNAITLQTSLGAALAQSLRILFESVTKIHTLQADRSRCKNSTEELVNQIKKFKDWDIYPSVKETLTQSCNERDEELARIDAELENQSNIWNNKEKDIVALFNAYSQPSEFESHLQEAISIAVATREASDTSKKELAQLRGDLRTLFTDNADVTTRISALEAAQDATAPQGKEDLATRQDLEALNSLIQTHKSQNEAQIRSNGDMAVRASEAQAAAVNSALKTFNERLRSLEDQQARSVENDKHQTERLDAFSVTLSEQTTRVEQALEKHREEASKLNSALQEMQAFNALKSDIEMGSMDTVKKELELQRLQLESMQTVIRQLKDDPQKTTDAQPTTRTQDQISEDPTVGNLPLEHIEAMQKLTAAVEHTYKRLSTVEIALYSLETRWNNVTTEPIVRQVITAFNELYPSINDIFGKVDHFSRMAAQSLHLHNQLSTAFQEALPKQNIMVGQIAALETNFAAELKKLTDMVNTAQMLSQSPPMDISKLEGDVAKLDGIISQHDQRVAELREKIAEFEKKERYLDFSLETLNNERDRQAEELESLSTKVDLLRSHSSEKSASDLANLEARCKQRALEDQEKREAQQKQLEHIQTQSQSVVSKFTSAIDQLLEFKEFASNKQKLIFDRINELEGSAREEQALMTTRLAVLEQIKEEFLQQLRGGEKDAPHRSVSSSPTRQIRQEMGTGHVRLVNTSTLSDLDPNRNIFANSHGKRRRNDSHNSLKLDGKFLPPSSLSIPPIPNVIHASNPEVDNYQQSPLSSNSSDELPISFFERRTKRRRKNKSKNWPNDGNEIGASE